MLSAIVTSDYIAAQSLQKGLNIANLKTLIYRTDFSIVDCYDFLYHDGFFIHLVEPTQQHLNFCLHLGNIALGKTIFVLAETDDNEILNSLKEIDGVHIFVTPFAFRNIAGIYNDTASCDLDCVHIYKIRGITLMLDATTRDLHIDGQADSVQLVNKEFFILKFLLTHKGKIVSKIDLLEFVWGTNLLASTDTVDVHMCRLRKKLKSHLNFDPIRTIHCAGYVFH